MNVVHVITGRGPTGPAAAAMSDVKALIAAGHRAYIACREPGGLADACAAEGLPYVGGLKLGRGAMRILRLPHDVRRLRAIMRDLALDVIHVHRSDDQLLASAAIGRHTSVKLIRTWHRDPGKLARPLLSRLLADANACVCVSREHVAGLKNARFIHAAVDTQIFKPPAHSSPRAEIRIAHVGRFKRERDGTDRGQRAALEVFSRLPRSLPWKGVLVGRGEMAEELRREAHVERKLPEDRVQLLEFAKQSPDAFADLLGSFDLGLVFATGSDGTSRAAVEMLASGVAVVLADRPGLREFAEDPSCALRQLPDDPAGWASAIEKLLRQPEKIAAMKKAARERAEKVHALRVRGEALAEVCGI
jgi:glycosyltransferase involved in cell wall biosynthesis